MFFSTHTCGSIGALFATPWPFGNDDFFKVTQLRQVGGDAAGLGFGGLLAGAVDGRRGERRALHGLTRHLRETR